MAQRPRPTGEVKIVTCSEPSGAVPVHLMRAAGIALKELAKSGGLGVELANAFDASPNPYVLLTPDLHIAAMNQAYLDVTSSRREELLGRPLFAAFDSGPGDSAPENVRQVRASIEKARDTRQKDHLAVVRFTVPRPGPTGELVFEEGFWSATHIPILDEAGEVAFILQHTTDITELERLRQRVDQGGAAGSLSALDTMLGGGVLNRAKEVQENNRRLETERNRLVELFMQAPGFIAVMGGPDHVFQLVNTAYAALIGRSDVEGKTVREALPEIAGQGFYELLDGVYQTGEPYEGRNQKVSLQRTPDAPLEDVWLDFIYQPIRDAEGKVVGVFVQGHDVTETVVAAERQKLMIDELNHRVKNTLATVQSIAMQTARHHPDPRGFAEAFQSRLMSLSHTHDLLTRSHWEGADLRAVLQHETDAHGGPTRIVPNGPPVALDPAQALSVGMIFHELATNAGKYGALSTPDGRVFVDWSVADQRAPRLMLSWRETGGPAVTPPDRRGFGSRLIERNVQHDLAGQVELDYATDGFTAEISIPLDKGR